MAIIGRVTNGAVLPLIVQQNITAIGALASPLAVTSGGTGLASTTANRILYSSASSTIGQITSANSAVLVTNSTGVPAFSSTMTNGQVIIGSTSGTPVAASLTAGSNITITPGAGSITIAASGGSGGMTLISTLTASTSATLEVTGLAAGYKSYQIEVIDLVPDNAGAGEFNWELGTGPTPTYLGSVYNYSGAFNTQGIGALTTTSGSIFGAGISHFATASGLTVTTNSVISGVIYLCDITSARSMKTWHSDMIMILNAATPTFRHYIVAGYVNDTTAMTAIKFYFGSGNMTSGTIKIYGIN